MNYSIIDKTKSFSEYKSFSESNLKLGFNDLLQESHFNGLSSMILCTKRLCFVIGN